MIKGDFNIESSGDDDVVSTGGGEGEASGRSAKASASAAAFAAAALAFAEALPVLPRFLPGGIL